MPLCKLQRECYEEEVELNDCYSATLDGEYSMEDLEKILFMWKMKLWVRP